MACSNNSELGTVSIGQKIELLDESSLQNSGLITLGQGGDFEDSSSVTNSGTIEIAGGTLNVQVDITNSGGVINSRRRRNADAVGRDHQWRHHQ